MRAGIWRVAAVIAASTGAAALGSCGDRQESPGADRAAVGTAGGDPANPGTAGAGGLSDANIVALLDEANQADSAAGAYALGKATHADVKQFAKLMMGEHHALRVQGQQLAQKLNVTPEPPANDPVQAAARSEMAALRAAPRGPEFDRIYIAEEIAIHKAVLDLAEQAHGAAQNAELKKLIEQARPVLEKHRDRAEKIQKKLGKPSA